MQPTAPESRFHVAVIGCGDVCFRRYLPALAELRGLVDVVATVDPRAEAAQRAVDQVAGWSPAARAFLTVEEMLAAVVPDAAFNLTPAPSHGAASRALLESGINVYSEKPLAGSREEADALIE